MFGLLKVWSVGMGLFDEFLVIGVSNFGILIFLFFFGDLFVFCY